MLIHNVFYLLKVAIVIYILRFINRYDMSPINLVCILYTTYACT